jgi:hypothetical protein
VIEPIKPNDVQKKIPDFVVQCFNELIEEHWNGTSSEFTLKAVLQKLKAEMVYVPKEYLDVEPIYEKVGWKVKFDKPGYDESYDAFYKFTKR